MKMVKRLSEMIAKHKMEKIELHERLKERPQGEIEESLEELYPPSWPYAETVGNGIAGFADALSKLTALSCDEGHRSCYWT